MSKTQIDTYVWGQERIIWGFNPEHRYTFKVLEPKVGQAGCLSLQYHKEKSESWLVVRGAAWMLAIVDGQVCTRILRPNDVQNLPAGVIHRITAIAEGTQIVEPSTPDRHASDKTMPKDVVRLHCYHDRPCDSPRNQEEQQLVAQAIAISDEAMAAIAQGKEPQEYNITLLNAFGAGTIWP